MKQRLPIILATTALTVAILGAVTDGLGAPPSQREGTARPAAVVRDVEVVEAKSPASSSTFRTMAAKCPSGKAPIGGGAIPNSTSPGFPVYLRYSAPAEDSWIAQAQELAPFKGKWRLTVIAVCAAVQ